jgi:serine/threonine protein kinase
MPLLAEIKTSCSTPLVSGDGGTCKDRVAFSPHYSFALFNTKTSNVLVRFFKWFAKPWKAVTLNVPTATGAQKVAISVTSLAKRLGLTPKEVKRAHKNEKLLPLIEERLTLSQPTQQFLRSIDGFLKARTDVYKKEAKKEQKTIRMKKGINHFPATMAFTPSGQIFIHIPSDKQGAGSTKAKKMALLIEPNGMMREVARVGGISEMHQQEFTNEREILESLQGDRDQIKFFGHSEGMKKRGVKKETFYLENFPTGSLYDYLKSPDARGLSVQQRYQIGRQLIRSLYGLHQRDIAHCDIKPGNAFYHPETGKAVLADFDVSLRTPKGKNQLVGTPFYLSPEKKKAYDSRARDWDGEQEFKADIWALGLVLHELFLGEDLIGERGPLAEADLDANRSLLPQRQNSPIGALIRDMLQFRPEKRPNIEQVLKRWNKAEKSLT